ncbi:Cytochrome P450 [Micromonospora sediminicola]|uniref:Cytochrome P450 n=1 Tax=Micromonospora sediminicola TaxID=946078 RepID=A0A1A9B976_9ACTN|nr:cytochrome P450 [Micromonospora sediminicola]SBT65693.1 Cytochrome P450 [Micromonospora sediminicola]
MAVPDDGPSRTSTKDAPLLDDRTDPVPGIDLARPELHRTIDLHAVFTDLRRDHPVFWHGPKSHAGFWSVTRHADTVRVYRDTDTFSATHGMTLDTLRPELDPGAGMMVEVTDPPEHRRLRRSIGAFFSAGAVSTMAPAIDDLVVRLLTDIRDRDEPVDFVRAVASRIPTHVAGLLLGLPPEDLDWITSRTSQVFLAGADASRAATADLREQAAQANAELLGYFSKLVRASRRRRSDVRGLVQRLAEGTGDREGLNTAEVILNSLNLAIAGTQTTRSSLSNMMLALIQFPDAFQALRKDPTLVPTAVEEAVRWANPVRHLARVATRDVELGGARIRAGDPVVVWPFSANRDEAVFRLPHVFDIRRYPNPHIGFATGTHSCPGSGLARAQMRTTLTRLVELFADADLADAPQLVQSNFLLGYERLPVRYTAAASVPRLSAQATDGDRPGADFATRDAPNGSSRTTEGM